MTDENTAALQRHHAAQDHIDLLALLYGEQAHNNCADRVLKERAEDVIDVLADDLFEALGASLPAFRHALAAGDSLLVGRMIMQACDRIAGQLVTDEMRGAEIARLKECDK